LILCTDGDCSADPNWVLGIVSFYEKYQPEMICGAVQVAPVDNAFTRFQALDLIGMMGITAVGVESATIRLCNGANLAYRKSAFLAVGGYEGLQDIPSGDDVLLLEKMQAKFPGKVRFLKIRKGMVATSPLRKSRAFCASECGGPPKPPASPIGQRWCFPPWSLGFVCRCS
jgi:hypothetical protein